MNAARVSKLFNWPIYNIVMDPSSDKSSLTQCWLKDLNNQQTADEFIAKWDREINSESRIKYQIEEDKTELCKYFQVGQCLKNDDYCDWKHVMCQEYRTCLASDCPYGHAKGIKTKITNNGR